jgi:pyruvate dehydrogenase E1 component
VLNITSVDRLHQDWRATLMRSVRTSTAACEVGHWGRDLLRQSERQAPIVTVLDGSPHALAFLGSVFGQVTVPLGMDQFGQSGERGDLYAYAGIDAGHIVNAALLALDNNRS